MTSSNQCFFYAKQLSILKQFENKKILDHSTRGIEKENLRVDSLGRYSQNPHPVSLGAAVEHPLITTDFAESLLEVVTLPISGIKGRKRLFQELADVTNFINQSLAQEQEALWAYSMPNLVDLDHVKQVAIADYGTSYTAKFKMIYRHGLSCRYGNAMQMIAGLHYNYSFPQELIAALGSLPQQETCDAESLLSSRYMGVVRNFYRMEWIIPLLFGASPACFSASLYDQDDQLRSLDVLNQSNHEVLWSASATSLRLSVVGYHVLEQDDLNINMNSLQGYIQSLSQALKSENPRFQSYGIKTSSGAYQQLSTGLLQIENEYYSLIRPKSRLDDTGSTLVGLSRSGIEYLEVRGLDLNLFEPLGMAEEDSAFLDLFLMHLLLYPSPPLSFEGMKHAKENLMTVILHGREKDIQLNEKANDMLGCNKASNVFDAAHLFLNSMQELASVMDQLETSADGIYQRSLALQLDKIEKPEGLPAHQLIKRWKQSGKCFADFILECSKANSLKLERDMPLSKDKQAVFKELALKSIASRDEKNTEQVHQTFEAFLKDYYAKVDL